MVTAAPAAGSPSAHASRPVATGAPPSTFPTLDVPEAEVPAEHARAGPSGCELAERDVVRHFTTLSQFSYGVDTGFYPLGRAR